jgi:hypothetical protein
MVNVCFMQRILTIALLLLSLTFLGQARVEPFSCGGAVSIRALAMLAAKRGVARVRRAATHRVPKKRLLSTPADHS